MVKHFYNNCNNLTVNNNRELSQFWKKAVNKWMNCKQLNAIQNNVPELLFTIKCKHMTFQFPKHFWMNDQKRFSKNGHEICHTKGTRTRQTNTKSCSLKSKIMYQHCYAKLILNQKTSNCKQIVNQFKTIVTIKKSHQNCEQSMSQRNAP